MCGRSRFLGLHVGLTEGFNGGEEACSAGRAAGGAVPDMALMQTREGVVVPEMLNGQCILLQLMHEGSNGRRSGKERCYTHDESAADARIIHTWQRQQQECMQERTWGGSIIRRSCGNNRL